MSHPLRILVHREEVLRDAVRQGHPLVERVRRVEGPAVADPARHVGGEADHRGQADARRHGQEPPHRQLDSRPPRPPAKQAADEKDERDHAAADDARELEVGDQGKHRHDEGQPLDSAR